MCFSNDISNNNNNTNKNNNKKYNKLTKKHTIECNYLLQLEREREEVNSEIERDEYDFVIRQTIETISKLADEITRSKYVCVELPILNDVIWPRDQRELEYQDRLQKTNMEQEKERGYPDTQFY